MKAKIEINLDNDAFKPFAGFELARVLRNLAKDLDEYPEAYAIGIVDINGNTVGDLKVVDDEPEEYLSTMIDGDDNHYNE
jgi:vacuolar-type H+-ATPase subunit B/Vma2